MEEEKKQRMLTQMREKKKKHDFYDNLSKKQGKRFKVTLLADRKGAIILTDPTSDGRQHSITQNFLDKDELEEIQERFLKEKARKEKLYALKPRPQLLEDRKDSSIDKLSISKQGSEAIINQTIAVDLTIGPRAPKNNIQYLAKMKNSASLPYLKLAKL